jgi:4-hydroxy-3-methylbut-2-en-1-yl diphosphate reductase
MQVILAQPRGFCAGVERAVEIVERALQIYPHPVYVLHEIVHNRYVVENLRQRGAVFVENLDSVPEESVCIFSAHGVATAIIKQANERKLQIIDATCPLVTKVHNQAQRYANDGYELIIIGHEGHPEVEGTRGCVTTLVHVVATVQEVSKLEIKNAQKLAYVTQTTLSVDDTREVIAALLAKFPHIKGPNVQDICYATQNRQNAVRNLAKMVNVLLVVGAHNSSNSNRLREVGQQAGIKAYLIQDADDLQPDWFAENNLVGVTAGASAPEILVTQVLTKLQALGVNKITTMDGIQETVVFKIPANLIF